ncbi:transcription elongation factor GreA [bacterium]|jgi:transcription elongation factor GreA|nr:transcription elongation factor GreA [bacterium]MBT4648706.1 transcription elongation factor GreA [bacterium]
MDRKILTPEGLEKLKEELEHLKNIKRREVTERIKTAKAFGDLSENAEYQEAKDEQAFVEGRIIELDNITKTAVVADKKDIDIVQVGSHVKVEKEDGVFEFTVVGSTEADPANGKISVESPLGNAFIGKSKNDELEVNLPIGVVKYKILDIS